MLPAINQPSMTSMNSTNSKHKSILNNVSRKKNESMNKSAILTDKFELNLAQEVPRWVVGYRNKKKSVKGLTKGQQQVKSTTIHRILEASVKQAIRAQKSQKSLKSLKSSSKIKKIKKPIKAIPRPLLNLLYRQNVKNYNPYILTLAALEQFDDQNEQQKNRIRRLCFIGIARDFFQKKKYFILPKYSRVGVLIRTYMVGVMQGNIEQKMLRQPQSVYVKINQTALSFNPKNRPKQLEEHITKKRYSQVIQSINKIIQREYEQYKKGNFQFIKSSLTISQIITYLLLASIVISLMVWTPIQGSVLKYIGFAIVLCVVFGGMGLSWIECNHALGKVCSPYNMTSIIQQKIKKYLKSISNDQLIWRVGTDFYWLEIQNIKVVKKKD